MRIANPLFLPLSKKISVFRVSIEKYFKGYEEKPGVSQTIDASSKPLIFRKRLRLLHLDLLFNYLLYEREEYRWKTWERKQSTPFAICLLIWRGLADDAGVTESCR